MGAGSRRVVGAHEPEPSEDVNLEFTAVHTMLRWRGIGSFRLVDAYGKRCAETEAAVPGDVGLATAGAGWLSSGVRGMSCGYRVCSYDCSVIESPKSTIFVVVGGG